MRMEEVNTRLAGWEKLLGKLTEYTRAIALFGVDKDFGAAVEGATSIWVGPQQHSAATDIQTGL